MKRWFSKTLFWDIVFSVTLGAITVILLTSAGEAWAEVNSRAVLLNPARDFEPGVTTCPAAGAGARSDRWFFNTQQILRTHLSEETPYTLTIYYRDGNLLTIPLSDMHSEAMGAGSGPPPPVFCRRHHESGRIVPFQMTPETLASSRTFSGTFAQFLEQGLAGTHPRFDRHLTPELLAEVDFQQSLFMARSFTEIGGYYAGCGMGGLAGTGIRSGRALYTGAINRLLTRLGERAVLMQGPNGVVRVGEFLTALEARNPHLTTLYTRLTGWPEFGRLLFTGTDLSLPNVARAAGTTYRGRIPTIVLNLLEDAGLIARNRVSMNGVVGEEIRIAPQAAEWLAPLFQAM